jgi:hypothetical protein
LREVGKNKGLAYVKIIGERRENLNSTLGQLPLRDSEGRTKEAEAALELALFQ